MIWVDREVKKIRERNMPLEWVDDMKTPSGRIHVGALRGVVIHDMIYKALLEQGAATTFTYVFEDHDPMDAIPSYLDLKKWEPYAGMQLYHIPSPEPGFDTYARYYAHEFQSVFNTINCRPKIIWGSKLYLTGKMNGVIKEVLDGAAFIRDIYMRVCKVKKPADWHPFQAVCKKCGKIGTTHVYHWDGRLVSYRCMPQMVAWAQGCGYEGKISPYNGAGKIPWKVEWGAKWKVIGVTIEGSGKDHMSAGGSYDVASAICREVLRYGVPYAVPYEWFIVGGRKMSSSKGIGASAKEVSALLPPDLLRFLIVRTPIGTALDFNPYQKDTLPNLFDDYDRCMSAYFSKREGVIPDGKQGEVIADFGRISEFSAVAAMPKKRLLLPRFRTVINLLTNKKDSLKFFTEKKGQRLTAAEKNILEERIRFAQKYLTMHNQTQESFIYTDEQKVFLRELSQKLPHKSASKEKIQAAIASILKKNKYQPRQIFPAFYHVLTGLTHGPKAADLIVAMGIDETHQKLKHI